jgi:hypothetical protein
MSSELGTILSDLKDKLNLLETPLVNQLRDLDKRGIKWFQYDIKKEKMIKENADTKVIYINVGGKQFHTTLLTLLNHPDTLFFNLIITDQWDINEELFIDRSYKYFNIILSYLRNKQVNVNTYKDEEIIDMIKEAKFYQLNQLATFLEHDSKEITYVSFEFSGEYRSSNLLAGTNNIDDLNNFEDRSCMKGICTNYTGWITLELSRDVEFDQIEIGGYRGNTNIYASSNGSGASIKTSLDKSTWATVGTIPSSYGNSVVLHNVTLSKARYVKFEHNSYLGIGYFRILKK